MHRKRRDRHAEGNVLDIGNPTSTDHVPSRETDEQRRRHRMERGADEVMTAASDNEEAHKQRGHGVVGADMGMSGEGTDFETPAPPRSTD